MPALRNPKWESFAHLVATDVSVTKAYAANYSNRTPEKSACRMLRIPEVAERIAEIKGNIARLREEKAALSYLTENKKRIECATLRHSIIQTDVELTREFDSEKFREARQLEEHVARLTGEWQPDGGRGGAGTVLVVIPASLAPAQEQPKQIDESMVIDIEPSE